MLELIILGQIPGTDVQISFDFLIKLALLGVAGVLTYVELFKIRPAHKQAHSVNELELDLAQDQATI